MSIFIPSIYVLYYAERKYDMFVSEQVASKSSSTTIVDKILRALSDWCIVLLLCCDLNLCGHMPADGCEQYTILKLMYWKILNGY